MKKLLLVFSIFAMFSCSSKDDEPPIMTSYGLKTDQIEVISGQPYDLSEIVEGVKPAFFNLSSENNTIATVDPTGVVNGISNGETYIVLEHDGHKMKVKVVVVVRALSYQEYYDKYCYGFNIGDTVNVSVLDKRKLDAEEETNYTYLLGTRKNKLWIAKFDDGTKKIMSEFIDIEDFVVEQTVHLGYGNYETFKVKYLHLYQYVENENGKVINVALSDADYISSDKNYKTMIIFENSGSIVKLTRNERYTTYLQDWYNDSYIFITPNGNYDIYDKMGQMIEEDIITYGVSEREMPVSYTDYLYVCYLWQGDTQPTLLRSWLGKHALNNNRWQIYLPIIKKKDGKYTYEVLSKEGDIWEFQFDVIEFSGEKHSHKYKINIETGKIVE